MDTEDIKTLILQSLPDAEVKVTGKNDHFSALVVSASFKGLSRIEQHKRVYAALGPHMGQEVHALQLTTRIPE